VGEQCRSLWVWEWQNRYRRGGGWGGIHFLPRVLCCFMCCAVLGSLPGRQQEQVRGAVVLCCDVCQLLVCSTLLVSAVCYM
jgi:hypothetical protein